MAKRKYSKMKKIEPSVQSLFFTTGELDTDSLNQFFIDVSQCASLVNRRFYRQGLNWAISGIRVATIPVSQGNTPSGYLQFSKLPNTWIMSNAWEKSFRAWQKMIKNATDESGTQSIKGKFLDFKIYADADHHTAGFGANLVPIQSPFNPQEYRVGQWQPSEIEVPSLTGTAVSTAWEMIAVGPSNPGVGASGLNAKSLVAGYEVSRALPDPVDPNVPVDVDNVGENWLLSMFTDGTQQDADVLEMLEQTGDNPPYPFEGDIDGNADTQYPGGQNNVPILQTHAYRPITGTTVGGETVIEGSNFPCGLIKLEVYNEAQPFTCIVQVDLVPGNHRGYLCEPMTEM